MIEKVKKIIDVEVDNEGSNDDFLFSSIGKISLTHSGITNLKLPATGNEDIDIDDIVNDKLMEDDIYLNVLRVDDKSDSMTNDTMLM